MAQALRGFQESGNGVFGCMWLDKFKVKQTKHPFWEKRWGSVWQKAAKGGTKNFFCSRVSLLGRAVSVPLRMKTPKGAQLSQISPVGP